MLIDNTAGLQYLLNEDIYLLKQDRDNLGMAAPQPVTPMVAEEPPATPGPLNLLAEPPALYFKFLGANAKNFLVICSYPELDNHIPDKHLEALKSALGRKELALDDVAILNIANHAEADIRQLTEYFKPQRLLILGQQSGLPGWDKLPLNQLQTLNGTKALYTYSFTEMLGDRDKTKAFWEQMKVL